MNGYRKVYTIDIIPLFDFVPEAITEFLHSIRMNESLIRGQGALKKTVELIEIFSTSAPLQDKLQSAGVHYSLTSIEHVPHIHDGTIDFSFSIDVFEHVRNPAAGISELHRVSSPSASGIHHISPLDHRCGAVPGCKPHSHFNYSDTQWNARLSNVYTNRWTLNDFTRELEGKDFAVEVLHRETHPIPPRDFDMFDKKYQAYPLNDLETTSFSLKISRPRSPAAFTGSEQPRERS